ncbi:MAG: signal peptidase I [Clostridia bacterium]|nr:signal peptidase I [Clostridia bacterium]
MKEEMINIEAPSSEQLENELIRVRYKERYGKLLKNTLYALLVVAAVSVLIATLVMPVLEIYGSSMNPTFQNGDIVVSVKTADLERGDICCLYYNNHILVKRVIGLEGDEILIDEGGRVFVNGKELDEPYVGQKMLGDCDIEFPYTVPEQTVFVLGDNRSTSVDSRNASIGCISNEEIVGKIIFRVWPLKSFGTVK